MSIAIYGVYVGSHQTTQLAHSPGAACRSAFRAAIRNGRRKRQPRTDPETGLFVGVHIECRGQHVSRLGQPTRFIDLTNAARRRAGLPEKKERTRIRS
jgi:hypothetical protein